MKLPKVRQGKAYEIATLIKALLSLHKDVHLSLDDIQVEYFESWDFYKVSIFRWSICDSGCGTKEYRDQLWIKHKTALVELFDMRTDPITSWRWKDSTPYVDKKVETDPSGSIPGMTYFVATE